MMKFVFVLDTSPLMQLKHSQNGVGMSFFQESVFAIEEFINHRKRLNEFKTDKYYLFRTISKNESAENCVLSGCEHPFKHFQQQLMNIQNTRDMIDFERTLIEVMRILNSSRFLFGASNRINGIQVTRIEPCNVIVFTANPKFKAY